MKTMIAVYLIIGLIIGTCYRIDFVKKNKDNDDEVTLIVTQIMISVIWFPVVITAFINAAKKGFK